MAKVTNTKEFPGVDLIKIISRKIGCSSCSNESMKVLSFMTLNEELSSEQMHAVLYACSQDLSQQHPQLGIPCPNCKQYCSAYIENLLQQYGDMLFSVSIIEGLTPENKETWLQAKEESLQQELQTAATQMFNGIETAVQEGRIHVIIRGPSEN